MSRVRPVRDLRIRHDNLQGRRALHTVPVRPRSVDFLSQYAAVGFVPSESKGLLKCVRYGESPGAEGHRAAGGVAPHESESRPGQQQGLCERRDVAGRSRFSTQRVMPCWPPSRWARVREGSHSRRTVNTCSRPTDPPYDVSVVDLATNQEVSRVKAGSSPWGITVVTAPTIKTASEAILRVRPSLKARARTTVGPVTSIGFSYFHVEAVGALPSTV